MKKIHDSGQKTGEGKRGSSNELETGSGEKEPVLDRRRAGDSVVGGDSAENNDPYLKEPLTDEKIRESLRRVYVGPRSVANKRSVGSLPGSLGVPSPEQSGLTQKKPVDSPGSSKTSTEVSPLDPTASTCGQDDRPHVDKGVKSGVWRVDYVRSSEGIYAFRVRLVDGKKKGTPHYVSWVSTKVFAEIRRSDSDYEQFKKQLIAEYTEAL